MATDKKIDVSFVVTISEKTHELKNIYEEFSGKMKDLNRSCEFVFVQDTDFAALGGMLDDLRKGYQNVKVVKLHSAFSESVALSAGFKRCEGSFVITLPVYHQINADDIGKILAALEDGQDVVAARRYPRKDGLLIQAEARVFNWLVRKMTDVTVHDLGSGVVGMKQEVALSLDIYGDLFRFIPILASRQGYKIEEVAVRHVKRRKKSGIYTFGVYVRRLLDILTLFFLVKFTKKPLRFFGLIGGGFFGIGVITVFYLALQRLFGVPIGNRPMLIFGVLLMVLGIQLLSIGLIGEIIIFTHAKKIKEYKVDKTLE